MLFKHDNKLTLQYLERMINSHFTRFNSSYPATGSTYKSAPHSISRSNMVSFQQPHPYNSMDLQHMIRGLNGILYPFTFIFTRFNISFSDRRQDSHDPSKQSNRLPPPTYVVIIVINLVIGNNIVHYLK
ncbi:hypothetical protein Plhal304r1_c082g0166881 [Plasmopara halstedii]